MIQEGVDELIIVANSSLSFTVNSKLSSLKTCKLTEFNYTDLSHYLPRHVLYNKHELVPVEDEAMVVAVDKRKLDLLMPSDPIVKWFGFDNGRVIRITSLMNTDMGVDQVVVSYRYISPPPPPPSAA